jgi:hypothetical protein
VGWFDDTTYATATTVITAYPFSTFLRHGIAPVNGLNVMYGPTFANSSVANQLTSHWTYGDAGFSFNPATGTTRDASSANTEWRTVGSGGIEIPIIEHSLIRQNTASRTCYACGNPGPELTTSLAIPDALDTMAIAGVGDSTPGFSSRSAEHRDVAIWNVDITENVAKHLTLGHNCHPWFVHPNGLVAMLPLQDAGLFDWFNNAWTVAAGSLAGPHKDSTRIPKRQKGQIVLGRGVCGRTVEGRRLVGA